MLLAIILQLTAPKVGSLVGQVAPATLHRNLLFFVGHSPEPWFPAWNRAFLEDLFRLLPHNPWLTLLAKNLRNPLFSTAIYALVFYLFWRIQDERTPWRRSRLLEIALACVLSVGLTLVARPWVGWPAPTRAESFQHLYPEEFQVYATANCFPSHSTLVYFTVAIGVWPFRRRLSLALAAFVLLGISLPRIYLGGHYPVDVLASVVLSVLTLGLVRSWCARPAVSGWLARLVSAGLLAEVALFLWVFELGEAFRATGNFVTLLMRVARSLAGGNSG